jgi:hypothetical protein
MTEVDIEGMTFEGVRTSNDSIVVGARVAIRFIMFR